MALLRGYSYIDRSRRQVRTPKGAIISRRQYLNREVKKEGFSSYSQKSRIRKTEKTPHDSERSKHNDFILDKISAKQVSSLAPKNAQSAQIIIEWTNRKGEKKGITSATFNPRQKGALDYVMGDIREKKKKYGAKYTKITVRYITLKKAVRFAEEDLPL